MSTNPIPPLTHRAKVLNDGLLDLAKWLAGELPGIDGGEEALFEGLIGRVSDLVASAHRAKAKDAYSCEGVIVCPHCRGLGGISWQAGDSDGWDECETCSATGYLPASFEP